MTDNKQGADKPVQTDSAPFDPKAELDEILAEVLANPRIKFTQEQLEAMDREQIGYDESVYPFLF